MQLVDTSLFGPVPTLEEIAIPLISPVEDGPSDIIPGLLPRQGQLVIAGTTNVGKSLLALEVSSSLITGEPLWGELQPAMKARKILYILGEHHNSVIQRLWQFTKLPMTDQVFLLGPEQLGFDKWLVTNGKLNIQALGKFKKWADGVDFVVFDPLSAFISGGGEGAENDNIQMRLLLDAMGMVASSAGASSLVLAHQGKPMLDQNGQEKSRKSYAIRGASGIEDAATNIFYMGKAEGHSGAAAGNEKVFELTLRKYKGPCPDRYALMRDPNTLRHTLLGNRPFVEVQKIETQAMYTRYSVGFPNASKSDLLKMVALAKQCSENTVRNHIGDK